MKRLKILLSNDDGINADGIVFLARELNRVCDLVVVAPDTERSAASHSISVHSSIKYKKIDYADGITAYSVSGTPADCVKFGILQIEKDCDMVVSGINRGSNIGTDIMYSGTVAAALEGAYLGKKAVAVSQADFKGGAEYYAGAAKFIAENLETFYSFDLPEHTIINVNYPVLPYNQIKDVCLAHMGIQDYSDAYIPDENDNGAYRLSGFAITHNRNKPGSDVEFIKKGCITVSPIAIDMTDYNALEKMRDKNTIWKK